MPNVTANGIQIEYDTFGDSSFPALLLVAGNGAQMIFWDVEFCELLAKKGYFVIRFDNRDAGLSTKFEEAGIPDFPAAIKALMEGKPVESAYSLDDMADDAVGLLNALGIEKAHICGVSMGGMIAQVISYRHPKHVLSLTSIMSSTGNPDLPQGKPDALAAVIAPSPEERGAYVEHNMNIWRTIWSPGFPFEEKRARTFIEKSYDRSYYPQGMARQNIAILANGDRRPSLSSIKVPTLVIHGADDPLIPVEGGKDTARAIPGARLFIINGMGHDMPKGVWAEIVDAISKHAVQANV
jgi:pimeloyl-ACP methyl ester carboxylesterase